MKVYDLERWRKINGIVDGIHPLWRGEETEQDFINRCASFETCDYCGQKIRVDLGQTGLGTELDCGPWKCDEYGCDSFICEGCIEEAFKIIQSYHGSNQKVRK